MNYQIIHIQDINEINDEVYGYLGKKEALFFLKWLSIIHFSYHVEVACISVKDDENRIVGVLLYYVSGNFFTGEKIYSSYDGLTVNSDDIAQILLDSIKMVALKRKAILINIFTSSQEYDFLDSQIPKINLGIDLTISKEELWSTFRDKTRNAIRKAQKTGLKLKKDKNLLADFYKIYSDRMQLKGVSFHSYQFFSELIQYGKHNFVIYVAEYQGISIASALILYDAKNAYYLFSGMVSGYENFCPMQFILWHAIEDCYDQGMEYFDMGESSINSGTYKFKIWFGCQPKKVYYESEYIVSNKIRLKFHTIMTKLYDLFYKLVNNLSLQNLKRKLLIKQRLNGKII